MPAPDDTTPRAVFQRLIGASLRGAWDELADLYAEDAVVEIPFAPPGVQRVTHGRETLRARFRAAGQAIPREFEKADPVVVRQTEDPNVIVTEWDLHGRLAATGAPFTLSYLMVLTVRDGLIVHSRDYADPIASATAFGRLPQLLEALAG